MTKKKILLNSVPVEFATIQGQVYIFRNGIFIKVGKG